MHYSAQHSSFDARDSLRTGTIGAFDWIHEIPLSGEFVGCVGSWLVAPGRAAVDALLPHPLGQYGSGSFVFRHGQRVLDGHRIRTRLRYPAVDLNW
jgi:hypothetical protein